jgi:hypothetical protein
MYVALSVADDAAVAQPLHRHVQWLTVGCSTVICIVSDVT